MAKHARIRRLRREAEEAAEVKKERGPISAGLAAERQREFRRAGIGRGAWFGSRVRRDIKQYSDFTEKRPKKTRVKKRGRR